MYFVGNMGTYLLVAVSVERLPRIILFYNFILIINIFLRYIICYYPTSTHSINYTVCAVVIIICIFFSGLWTTVPLLGWSYYEPEGLKVSCSVKWDDQSANILSYNIIIYIFAFFLPVIIMFFTNTQTVKLVRIYNYLDISRCISFRIQLTSLFTHVAPKGKWLEYSSNPCTSFIRTLLVKSFSFPIFA